MTRERIIPKNQEQQRRERQRKEYSIHPHFRPKYSVVCSLCKVSLGFSRSCNEMNRVEETSLSTNQNTSRRYKKKIMTVNMTNLNQNEYNLKSASSNKSRDH